MLPFILTSRHLSVFNQDMPRSANTSRGQVNRERVFAFVQERILDGVPPTVREVQRALGFRAVESARAHLDALVFEKRLDRITGKSRGFRLPVPTGPTPFLIPLLGRVQAGALTTAVEDPEGFVATRSRFPREELFALRVQGDSMTGAGILPGDVVLVRRQPSGDSGDIVVALVDDEATVKRLHRARGRIELRPENPNFEPIVPDPENLEILGKVIEVRRFLDPTAPSWADAGA